MNYSGSIHNSRSKEGEYKQFGQQQLEKKGNSFAYTD